jgi:hypothetical protein
MSLLLPNACEPCECCVQYMFYSYYNDSAYGDANCTPVQCGGGECDPPPCCCGLSITSTIFSEEYDQKCFDLLTPRAIILGGSLIDNSGSVGGVAFSHTDCELGYLPESTEVVPSRSGLRLSLPFTVANDSTCGPYGLNSVYIKWYFN